MRIPRLDIKIMLESSPPKSGVLVGRLAVDEAEREMLPRLRSPCSGPAPSPLAHRPPKSWRGHAAAYLGAVFSRNVCLLFED